MVELRLSLDFTFVTLLFSESVRPSFAHLRHFQQVEVGDTWPQESLLYRVPLTTNALLLLSFKGTVQ